MLVYSFPVDITLIMQYTTTVKRRTIDKHALTMYKVSIKVDVLIIVSYRIQEIVMSPAYENKFTHGYTILLSNAITVNCSFDVDHF